MSRSATRPFRQAVARAMAASRRSPRRLRVENLEDRSVPATFTVTNANDLGAGSLRQAITDANTAAGADTVVFDAATFGTAQTINLASALPVISSTGGDLTITGPGSNLLTVKGGAGTGGNFRVFETGAAFTTITGLKITGGNPTADGGGILVTGSSRVLMLDGVIIDGNSATGEGGGIYLPGTNYLNIKNSTVSGNSATTDGGGIYFFSGGGLFMENTTVSGNTAGGQSGGLYWFSSPNAAPPAGSGITPSVVTIRNSTFSNNTTTTGVGAGIDLHSMSSGTALIENVTVSGNNAKTTGGGLMHNSTGTVNIVNSRFIDNVAQTAGGAIASSSSGTITITGTTITGNTAATVGGAIALTGATALTVQQSTLHGNTATQSGGAISVGSTGAVGVFGATITGNAANGTAAGQGGGGIARTTTAAGTVTIANSVVSGNTATTAGPDILTGATGTTLNVNFSAVGAAGGHTLSGTSGNNLAHGASLQLGNLANNGGLTQTRAPAAGSPLINAGSAAFLPGGTTFDQRGFGYVRSYEGVDIGAMEVQPEGVPFAVATAADVTVIGATSHTFTVTYQDVIGASPGISTASLIDNNNAVRVTGPNGFDVAATYVSIDNAANGTPRTVTYSITVPGGTIGGEDLGTYSINVQPSQVQDLTGTFVQPGSVGTFKVVVPATFTVTNADDAGPGSLRDALTRSIENPPADTIVFDPTFFNTQRTISLLTALPVIATAGGALTVVGPGADFATVQRDPTAAANFRLLDSTAPAGLPPVRRRPDTVRAGAVESSRRKFAAAVGSRWTVAKSAPGPTTVSAPPAVAMTGRAVSRE
ncbi:MAG TPA: right-handed parallel beta-helix repeat-containing protein, partial [Gemmataceae bacterium]|nr:right-handed parallel beta-helix repeat-containing protein [Gemmataceae bacterium]